MNTQFKNLLLKQKYCFSGSHACVKTCLWLKKTLRQEGECYKNKFYNIQSHRCVQMTPIVSACTQNCLYCWRPSDYMSSESIIDTPKDIVENSIQAQRKLITGFKGNEKVSSKMYLEAYHPKHFAISLAGEPCLYPHLGELIEEIHKKNMTSFLVTNGTMPKKIEDLKCLPTQLYISLSSPNKDLYDSICNPLIEENWDNLNKTLELLPKIKTRKVLRITLVKNINDSDLEGYSNLIKKASPHFVEVKAYMHLGSSKEKLSYKNMPSHEDVMKFSKKLSDLLGWSVIDEKEDSRVSLLAKQDYSWRKLKI